MWYSDESFPRSRNRELMIDAFKGLSPKQKSLSLYKFSPMPLPALVSEEKHSFLFQPVPVKYLRQTFQLHFKVVSSARCVGANLLASYCSLRTRNPVSRQRKHHHNTPLKQSGMPKEKHGHFMQPEEP